MIKELRVLNNETNTCRRGVVIVVKLVFLVVEINNAFSKKERQSEIKVQKQINKINKIEERKKKRKNW